MSKMENIVVTSENIALYQSDECPLQIGDVVQVRKSETVDLRPFGQLRSWLFGDYPPERL